MKEAIQEAMEKSFENYRKAIRFRTMIETATGEVWEVYRRSRRYFLRKYFAEGGRS